MCLGVVCCARKVFFHKDAVQVIGEILHEVYHCNIDLVLRLLSLHVHSDTFPW